MFSARHERIADHRIRARTRVTTAPLGPGAARFVVWIAGGLARLPADRWTLSPASPPLVDSTGGGFGAVPVHGRGPGYRRLAEAGAERGGPVGGWPSTF